MKNLLQQIYKERYNFIKLYNKCPIKITIAYNYYKILEDNLIIEFETEKFKNKYTNIGLFDKFMGMNLIINRNYLWGFKLE